MTTTEKTMQKLLDEIDQVRIDVEDYLKTYEETTANDDDDHSDENQIQIRNFNEHINNLQKQMNAMTKESDSKWPVQTFDESKQNALKILLNLSKRLNQINQHLEETVDSSAQSAVSSTKLTTDENKKGVEALISRLPLNDNKKPIVSDTTKQNTPSLSTSDNETISDEEHMEKSTVMVRDRTQELPSSAQVVQLKETLTSSDEDDSEQQADQYTKDSRQQKTKPYHKNLISDRDRQSRTSTPLRSNQNPPPVDLQSSSSSSSSSSTSSNRHKTTTSNQPVKQNTITDDDSSFDEDEDEDEDDEESSRVDATVEKLQMTRYPPGIQFHVLHSLNGAEIGDLTIHKDEVLTLVKQQDDNWWLFKNPQTKQEGLVPINYIKLYSERSHQLTKHRKNTITSTSSSLVDVFKANNDIPSGFVASSLASLTHQEQYKLPYTLIPKMTESNFNFADLHWQYDIDRISAHPATYQKILRIKECVKIPKIEGKNIEVFNRCVRICLYDGFKILSNIHSSRIKKPQTLVADGLTEDWHFNTAHKHIFIDEESNFLIRSNEYDPSKSLHILIELSQFCRSKINKETCEVACGWIMIPLSDDRNDPLDTDGTMNYNKRLHGGHFQQPNILLDSQYKNLHSHGLSGKLDRYKQARIRFSIESREDHTDTFYNQLPLTSMIVPKPLIHMLVFYRNELAFQLHRRSSSSSVSTTPLQSIFLSTFYQALEQPELIYVLQLLYHRNKKLTDEEQRKEFIKTYELSVYPLLFYRSLPPYNFHKIGEINERRALIMEMINKHSLKKGDQPDILALLLDPKYTDKWTPFTTDEICFSLQKYIHTPEF